MSTLATNYASTTDTTAITITLASLASSSGLITGREALLLDNTSSKYVGGLVSGSIRTGASPTGGQIAIYVYPITRMVSSAASWPYAGSAQLTGADAGATFDVEQVRGLKLAASMAVNTTSGRNWDFEFALEPFFGGWLPLKCGIWVAQSTGVNLDSTAANSWIHGTWTKLDLV